MIDGSHIRQVAGVITLFTALLAAGSRPAGSIPHAGAAHRQAPPAGTQQKESAFVSDDKRFSIWMPGTPKREDVKTTSTFGPVVVVIYMVAQPHAAYSISYTDFSASKIANVSPEKLLAMSSDGAHKKYGKGVIKDEKITYHGFPGRALICRADTPAKFQADMRAVLVKNRLYTMSLVHTQSDERKDEIAHFLDSFKLLK